VSFNFLKNNNSNPLKNMKSLKLFIFFLLISLTSCQSSKYIFVDSTQKIGVDFTKGKWLLNEIDCPEYSKDALTSIATDYFKKNLKNRLFYIKDVNGLLIARKINLNPNKTKLKELKDGTSYDFFINIVANKSKSELSSDLYGNQSEVFLEIYDLNLQQIIYSKHVIGYTGQGEKSTGSTVEQNVISNIPLYKSSSTLMQKSLKKILKDLEKTSIN
jgi:hypothetical protein